MAGYTRKWSFLPLVAVGVGAHALFMFSVHCPRHGERVLLTERRIRALHNTTAGIVLEVECYDGERIFVVTGRGATVDPVAAGQVVMSLTANRRQAANPKTVA